MTPGDLEVSICHASEAIRWPLRALIFSGGGGMPPDPPKCVYAKHAARPYARRAMLPPPPPLNPHSQALIITYNRVLSTSTSTTRDEKLDESLGTRLLSQSTLHLCFVVNCPCLHFLLIASLGKGI